jgi:hypothetical protein
MSVFGTASGALHQQASMQKGPGAHGIEDEAPDVDQVQFRGLSFVQQHPQQTSTNAETDSAQQGAREDIGL